MGSEEKENLLVAAWRDTCIGIEQLTYELTNDGPYEDHSTKKMATSRIAVCKVSFKQNVGHLGCDINACAVHCHYKTMKCDLGTLNYDAFWQRLLETLVEYKVKFLLATLTWH